LPHEPQLGGACVVAVSPPRLSYSVFCASTNGQAFLETYAAAEKHVQAGAPAALLDVKLPLPFALTAAGFLEKYGPDERYNYLTFLPGVPCPTLVTLGEVEAESNMAFQGTAEAIRNLGPRTRRVRVETIPGADHFYTGVRPELLTRVEAWLRDTMPAP